MAATPDRPPRPDRHTPKAALPPRDRTARSARYYYAPDADVDRFSCCIAELSEAGWTHERSCPARSRTA